MTARAPSFPPVEDPVLRSIARAQVETDPLEIAAAAEAERHFIASGGSFNTGGRAVTHEQLVTSLCAHDGITREEWDAAGREP